MGCHESQVIQNSSYTKYPMLAYKRSLQQKQNQQIARQDCQYQGNGNQSMIQNNKQIANNIKQCTKMKVNGQNYFSCRDENSQAFIHEKEINKVQSQQKLRKLNIKNKEIRQHPLKLKTLAYQCNFQDTQNKVLEQRLQTQNQIINNKKQSEQKIQQNNKQSIQEIKSPIKSTKSRKKYPDPIRKQLKRVYDL